MTYNLANEVFLSVRYIDGHYGKCSLNEVLKNAHLVKQLDYPYPVKAEMYAIYRFLSEIVADIFRPDNSEHIYEIYEDGHFDETIIDTYFEKYKNRFNLFDKSHPFMQTLPAYFKDFNKSERDIATMSPLLRSGNNDIFYYPVHFLQSESRWTPEHVVGNLLFCNMNHVKTGNGYKAPIMGGSGTTPLYVLHEAENLFKTIILEMDPVGEDDIPYWRRDGYGEIYKPSLMNYEFYPVMKFFYDEKDFDGEVFNKVYFESDNAHPIFKMSDKELSDIKNRLQLSHPGTIERVNSKDEKYPEMASTNRESWLNLGILCKSRTINNTMGRPVFEIMEDEGTAPETLTISYFGVHKGKVGAPRNIHQTIQNVPFSFIFDKDKQNDADHIIGFIETVGSRLDFVTKKYAAEALKGSKIPRMYNDVKSLFYRNMESIFFIEYVYKSDADKDTFIQKTSRECIKIFKNLPAVRDDEITKRVYERQLLSMISKEMDKIYGKHSAETD